jgi:hypothetical protein
MNSQRTKLRPNSTALSKAGLATVAVFGGLALVSSSIFASLNATAFNETGQDISTQTLILTQGAAGTSAGISTAIANLGPADVTNRYVDLTNAGTMDAKDLTLLLTDSAGSTLTSSATKGLQVAIYECSVAWNVTNGTCSGTTSTALGSISANAVTLAAQPVSVASLASTAVSHLRLEITLPATNEVTVNGALPLGTIQGVTSTLTWTFRVDQRLPEVTQG